MRQTGNPKEKRGKRKDSRRIAVLHPVLSGVQRQRAKGWTLQEKNRTAMYRYEYIGRFTVMFASFGVVYESIINRYIKN